MHITVVEDVYAYPNPGDKTNEFGEVRHLQHPVGYFLHAKSPTRSAEFQSENPCERENAVSSRTPIWLALGGNVAVAAATYLGRGWSVAGAHAGARNTARFSALWFVVAFAAPGFVRYARAMPDEVRLVQSFFAAHAIHFATVALLLWRFEFAHISGNPIRAAEIILIGFGIVMVAGVTAKPRESRIYTAIHKIALYAVFVIFFLAFAHNRVPSLRLMAVGLGLALVLRVTSGMRFYRVKTAE